jgi:hypothetical protein
MNTALPDLDLSSKGLSEQDAPKVAPTVADSLRANGAMMTKLTISGDKTYSEPVTIETCKTEADFSGKFLNASGAIKLAAFLPKCQ